MRGAEPSWPDLRLTRRSLRADTQVTYRERDAEASTVGSPSESSGRRVVGVGTEQGERPQVSDLQTVRYPSGATEFRLDGNPPEVGDVIARNGDTWVIQEITTGKDGSPIVTLRLLTATDELLELT